METVDNCWSVNDGRVMSQRRNKPLSDLAVPFSPTATLDYRWRWKRRGHSMFWSHTGQKPTARRLKAGVNGIQRCQTADLGDFSTRRRMSLLYGSGLSFDEKMPGRRISLQAGAWKMILYKEAMQAAATVIHPAEYAALSATLFWRAAFSTVGCKAGRQETDRHHPDR